MAEQQTISELIVSLGLDSKDFDSGIQNVNKSTKQMEQAFRNNKKALELSEKSIDDYNKAIDSGENVIKQYEKKIEELTKAYQKQEQKLRSYTQQQAELPQKIEEAKRELQELEQTLGKSSDEYKQAESNLKAYEQQLNGMDRTINTAVNSLRSLENQIQGTQNRMQQAENETQQYREELGRVDDAASGNENSSNIFDRLQESINSSGVEAFTGEIGGLDSAMGLLKGGAVLASAALAGMFVANVLNAAKEYDQTLTDLQINLGLTKDAAEDMQGKIMQFSDGGYNIESISEAVELLSQQFNMTDEEIERVSKTMSILNGYGYETNDMVRFLKMAYNDWGYSAEQSLGLIIEGQQNGMNIAGDLMDTLIEYSNIFSQMGIDGEEAFNLISSAMQDTGMDSDKVADVLKEFSLTLTDGSTASADALKSIGINYDDLRGRIDSGKITMTDAFKEVSSAILNVGDETKRAQVLQEILKGTIEFGNDSILQSWVNVKNSTIDAEGAIDQVTQAYEESYAASQQDFSNSWAELSQTIGSLLLPAMTAAMDGLTDFINGVQIGVDSFGLNIQTMANQLKACILEIGISLLEHLANLPFADKIMPNLDSTLQGMKQAHKETIEYIQNNESQLKENAKKINGEYKTDKENTFNSVAQTADTKTKEMAQSVDNNTKAAKDSAKQNTDGLKSDLESSLSGLGNIATTKTGEIPKATQQNLSESSRIIRQFGSDAYNGVRTSFSKLEQSAKQSMTSLYKGVTTSMSKTKTGVMQDATTMYNQSKKSFEALNRAGRSSFTELYRGTTTSSSKMRTKVIADWNAIRAALSKDITGKVSIKKTTTVSTQTQSQAQSGNAKAVSLAAIPQLANLNTEVATLDTSTLDYNSTSTYKPSQLVSNRKEEKLSNNILSELTDQNKMLKQALVYLLKDNEININTSVQLEGKEIAKASAKYMKSEISAIEKREGRLAGMSY